jgi:hypothetical protein
MEKASAVHYFPNCKSGDLGVEPIYCHRFQHHMLEMKEQCGMDRWEIPHTPAQGLLWRSGPRRGTPARELRPTAAYRLGVDKGGG